MKTENKVQLIGYLGRDPELIVFPSGTKKANLRLATDRFVQKQDNEKEKITTWHTVVAWGALAEIAKDTFIKGSHVMVEGSISYRTYTGRDGNLRCVAEIKVNEFTDLDR